MAASFQDFNIDDDDTPSLLKWCAGLLLLLLLIVVVVAVQVRTHLAQQRRSQLLLGAAAGFVAGTGLYALVDSMFPTSSGDPTTTSPLQTIFGGHVSDEELYMLRHMLQEMRRRRQHYENAATDANRYK